MGSFYYRGRHDSGKLVSGFLEAPSADVVASKLSAQQITPLNIRVATDFSVMQILQKTLGIGTVPLSELEMFSRQMYTLTHAGVPLMSGIRVIADSTEHKVLKKTLYDVSALLEAGRSLSDAMQQHPVVFPELMTAMVGVGENTGKLEEAFEQLAAHFERETETKKLLKSATRYPTLVIVFVIAAVLLVNTMVIPSFTSFFEQYDTALPWQTQWLIASSHFFIHYWSFVVSGLVLFAVSWLFFLETDRGASFWDRYKLKLPLIGSILMRSALGRFARTFALTTSAGVPIQQAFTICARAVDNHFVGEKMMEMRTRIEHGASFSHAAQQTGLFTSLILQMISIGEETGEMEALLTDVAQHYERDVAYDVKRMGDAIEPVLISFIAVMVLILALGVFLPMWDLASVSLS